MRPRSGVELIDASVQFFRGNFAVLFTTTVVAFAPIAVAEYLAAIDPTNTLRSFTARIITWVFGSMAQAAAVHIVATRYVDEDVTAADALRAVWARLGTVMAATFVFGLLVGIGTLLLVFPGIYAATTYCVVMAAVMVEGLDSTSALRRSSELTKGSKTRILGIFLVAFVVYFLLVFVVAFALGLLTSPGVTALGARLFMAVANPFLSVLLTLLYFDLRIRREGLDIDMMMTSPLPAAVTSVVTE